MDLQSNQKFVDEIRSRMASEHILLDEPMKEHTTFRIGGPADYLIFPASMEDVAFVFRCLKKHDIPFVILGNGSNVLVLDKGIRGAVIKFNSPISAIRKKKNTLTAGAGALLRDVSEFAAENSLSGMEFACGIPGSIGGAVFMNAGAYDGEMKNIVSAVRAISPKGEIVQFAANELDFGYRHSIFQENDCAICEVDLTLAPGNAEEIKEKIAGFTKRRESKQPLEMPSAGSTFKRPEGHYAGTLIEQTGLKGFTVGGAQVSDKHAGFVVNAGDATAKDVLELIRQVQDRVFEKHHVKLFPEVRILGEA
ncbi:UDP-N-acetylmuramate dehydrogenase [Selenomonas sputigena]|uniref:UDP-N-acetylmuramate dehydrogenase n=1 Tax=Selenomonas sputigena TaxID=69823 RepID=UPI002231FE26|nr:UDP-N-acetylmuramate dehydrogenase [Selenomonas sputigena]UZD43670.1 UDP-N-acetylmuramate dehydrogenase [Selenomonas sputigena]